MAVILEMPFLTVSNANILFAKQELIWKSYIITKALPTIKRVWIINWKKFVPAVLDPSKKAFILYIAYLGLDLKISIHLAWKAQIALLVAKKVTVLAKYMDYADVFSKESAEELSKQWKIN